MAKIKHVPFDECFLYFFVCPVDKELVVEISLFSQSTTEVDRVLKTSSIPVGLQQDAKLLGAS
jgi:hypothetical protein